MIDSDILTGHTHRLHPLDRALGSR